MNKKTFICSSSFIRTLAISVFFFLALHPFRDADAFNLNCGNDFVSEGDSKIEVLRTCGEPILKEFVGTVRRNVGSMKVELIIEHWYYTETWRATSEDMLLVFHGSQLVRIERADGRF